MESVNVYRFEDKSSAYVELCDYTELEDNYYKLKQALEWIVRVNACEHEYKEIARKALEDK